MCIYSHTCSHSHMCMHVHTHTTIITMICPCCRNKNNKQLGSFPGHQHSCPRAFWTTSLPEPTSTPAPGARGQLSLYLPAKYLITTHVSLLMSLSLESHRAPTGTMGIGASVGRGGWKQRVREVPNPVRAFEAKIAMICNVSKEQKYLSEWNVMMKVESSL